MQTEHQPISRDVVERLPPEQLDEAIRLTDQLANAQRALNDAARALHRFWQQHA